ncbi:copper resistance protein CopC/CopD [Dactylosporangium vinaceum]|uniref:Copper resistance CopC/CopD family protein n=1 Tax=Dactylosporangium vinaceum TaxID=53362 RepID=A0ABV5LZ97_9ACTN|nr:copper resistance protein CopC [Dactylosporangium vinaceum]UAB92569.1 copper resistance protein CopC/CopD [Dactylosporangium vinaceum]
MRWLVAAVAGVLFVLAAPALPASAHAVLSESNPRPGAVVATLPGEIRLAFNEAVHAVPGKTVVAGPDGKRINAGDPAVADGALVLRLRAADRVTGTYVVSYRVISADSHPVSGSFTFSVGAPSAGPAAAVPTGIDPIVRALVPAAKYAGYVGLVLLIGPAVLLAVWYPRRLSRAAPLRLARAGIYAAAGGTVAALWLQAPAASGAALLDVAPAELWEVLTSQFGLLLLARLVALGAVAVILPRLRRRPDRRLGTGLALVAVGGLVTWPLTGHPVASPYAWLLVAADVVHLAAMGLWLGGLIVLAAVVLRRADPRELRLILPSWSRWALITVYWLVAAGVLQALVQLGGWPAVTGSTYGRLILVKGGLVVGVLAIAYLSRRLVQRGAFTAARLRRSVGVEAALAMAVLAASAVLVQLTPGRTVDVEAAAAARARGFATTLTSPLYAVQFEVYPAAVGEYNSFHAFVYTPEGRPLEVVEWTVTAALPGQGIEPMPNPVYTLTGNQGLGNITFPFAGDWRLTLTLRVSDFDQATVTAQVPVT